jgi:hypothetical protein
MNIMKILDDYESKFGKHISIPFELPANKTLEDFGFALETCIHENRSFDANEWGFGIEGIV